MCLVESVTQNCMPFLHAHLKRQVLLQGQLYKKWVTLGPSQGPTVSPNEGAALGQPDLHGSKGPWRCIKRTNNRCFDLPLSPPSDSVSLFVSLPSLWLCLSICLSHSPTLASSSKHLSPLQTCYLLSEHQAGCSVMSQAFGVLILLIVSQKTKGQNVPCRTDMSQCFRCALDNQREAMAACFCTENTFWHNHRSIMKDSHSLISYTSCTASCIWANWLAFQVTFLTFSKEIFYLNHHHVIFVSRPLPSGIILSSVLLLTISHPSFAPLDKSACSVISHSRNRALRLNPHYNYWCGCTNKDFHFAITWVWRRRWGL